MPDATAIFTIAEARAFDKGQLTSPTRFSDIMVAAKEVAIRAKFERVIGVALIPTTYTDYLDGDGTDTLYLPHHNPWGESTPRPVEVTSVTVIGADDTETDFTADELSDLVCYPHKLVRRSGYFAAGLRNIKVVYKAGYITCPDDIKQAALQVIVLPQPDGLMPAAVSAYAGEGDDGGIKWTRVKDPSRGRWYGNELVDAILREHRAIEEPPRIA